MKKLILAVTLVVSSFTAQAGVISVDANPKEVCAKFESVLEQKHNVSVVATTHDGNRMTYVGGEEVMRTDFLCHYKVITSRNKVKSVKVVLYSHDGSYSQDR
jgi:hypothetical protein